MGIPDYSRYPDFEPQGPPEPRKRKFPIFNVVPGKLNILTPRQSQIVVVGRHWDDEQRRSILCAGEDGSCPFDHESQSYRWTGYLLADVAPIKDRKGKSWFGTVILHITPGGASSCPPIRDKNINLLEWQIEAVREGETERSPVKLALVNHRLKRPVPIVFDLRTYIRSTFQAPNNVQRRIKKGGQDR